jgi:hypothetical protein
MSGRLEPAQRPYVPRGTFVASMSNVTEITVCLDCAICPKSAEAFVILTDMTGRLLNTTPPPNAPNLGETTRSLGAFEMRKGRGCRQHGSCTQLGWRRDRRAGRERRRG